MKVGKLTKLKHFTSKKGKIRDLDFTYSHTTSTPKVNVEIRGPSKVAAESGAMKPGNIGPSPMLFFGSLQQQEHYAPEEYLVTNSLKKLEGILLKKTNA